MFFLEGLPTFFKEGIDERGAGVEEDATGEAGAVMVVRVGEEARDMAGLTPEVDGGAVEAGEGGAVGATWMGTVVDPKLLTCNG